MSKKLLFLELSLNIKHQVDMDSPGHKIASFCAKSLELDLMQQTYNTKISLRLAGIGLIQYHQEKEIKIISTPYLEGGEQYLFQIRFTQVDKSSPEFHSTYKSCESTLVLEFAKLGVVLHKEGLLSMIKFGTELQSDIEETWGDRGPRERIATTHSPGFKQQLSVISEGLASSQGVLIGSRPLRFFYLDFC
jgi:hypothetical protein